MTINYRETEIIKKDKTLEIQDPEGIFLESNYYEKKVYLGVWSIKNDKVLVIIEQDRINFEYPIEDKLQLTNGIKKYLDRFTDTKIITKAKFKKQLQQILKLLQLK